MCEDLLHGGSQLKGGVEENYGRQHLKFHKFPPLLSSKISTNNLGHNFSKHRVEEDPRFNAPVVGEGISDVVNLSNISNSIFSQKLD